MQEDISQIAHKIRRMTFEAIATAGRGHYGGSLSISEILAVLYFKVLNIDPANPKDEKRDRFILSKGHGGPALYSTLALRGYFPYQEVLDGLDKPLSNFPKHIDRLKLDCIEASTGPLGQGLSMGCGMGITFLQQGRNNRVYVLGSDGECDSGQQWEAVMTAAKYRLGNLILIIDRNNLQIDGCCDDIMPTDPLDERFEAFGWMSRNVDGHNTEEIETAIREIQEHQQKEAKPGVVIAKTVKGRGVSFMENEAIWHSGSITREQYEQAVEELGGDL
ncbi:MAG: transketolase [Sediminispirochaetaceae bacterium]